MHSDVFLASVESKIVLLLVTCQQQLQAGATVLAVEKDYAFAERLEEELGSNAKFKILQGDILRLNIDDLINSVRELHGCASDDTRRIRIVANLPYYITTDVLKQLLPLGDKIESLLLLLQDEVAERLTTEHPGERLAPQKLVSPCRVCIMILGFSIVYT